MNEKVLQCHSFNAISVKLRENNVRTLTTGITTAHEISDNQLREFILTHKLWKSLSEEKGVKIDFLLINDSCDAFTERYYARLVKFDAQLKHYNKYIGMRICDIPSPYDGFDSLSNYFEKILLRKLANFQIYPEISPTHTLYDSKYYQDMILCILENESKIKGELQQKCDREFKTLYRPVCKFCKRISSTFYNHTNKTVECADCSQLYTVSSIPKGKLIWPIDCALRWNYHNVGFEAFTENYLKPEIGTYYLSSFISQNYFDSVIPITVQFSYFKYSEEIRNSLDALPFEIIETINTNSLTNPNYPNSQKIVEITKNYEVNELRYYDICNYIHLIYPHIILSTPALHFLNSVFFNYNNFQSDDFYEQVKHNVEKCYYFSLKYISRKMELNPFSEYRNFSKEQLKSCKECLITEGSKPTKNFYEVLFRNNFGPDSNTFKKFLPVDLFKKITFHLDEALGDE